MPVGVVLEAVFKVRLEVTEERDAKTASKPEAVAALESKVAVQVLAKSKVIYGGIASVKTAIAGGVCEDRY